jgi:GR25 family glycosyltransferase involved in LPS biosynthesis
VNIDKIYCICMEDRPAKKENLLRQLNYHFPLWDPEVFNAINTRYLNNHHIGCALSHRSVIQEARDKKYKNILVLEEDARLHKNFKDLFNKNLNELRNAPWDILYLGACVWDPKPPKKPRTFESVQNCDYLKILTRSTCTQGLAYNNTCYDYILKSLPSSIEEMTGWCKEHRALDQWLMYKMQGIGSVKEGKRKFNCYITSPRVCSQPFLVGNHKQDKPRDFCDKLQK